MLWFHIKNYYLHSLKTDSYSLSILPQLIVGKDKLALDDVPEPFRKDLKSFIIGETFMPSPNGKIIIGANLYRSWINKLIVAGFDEDVKLAINENEG